MTSPTTERRSRRSGPGIHAGQTAAGWAFTLPMIVEGVLAIDWSDEVIAGTALEGQKAESYFNASFILGGQIGWSGNGDPFVQANARWSAWTTTRRCCPARA